MTAHARHDRLTCGQAIISCRPWRLQHEGGFEPNFATRSKSLNPAFGEQESRFARAFALIRDAIEQRAFPGAALAVTHRGALVASQGFGRFTYDPTSPEVHADTVFDLASVTKVVATTAIAMLLYERGLLTLDSPVAAILPEFRHRWLLRQQRADREAVTVRMLLTHSSGLPAYVKLFETAHTRDELIRCGSGDSAGRRSRLESRLQRHRIYSARRNSRASAGDRRSMCSRKTEIFAPLGMSRTCFNPPAEWKSEIPPTEDDRTFRHRVIQGEVNDENAWVMGGVAGHAGLFAPATDVARFAECMLRGGSPIFATRHGRAVHSPRSFARSAPLAPWDGTHPHSHPRLARISPRGRSGTSASPALRCGSIPTASSA